MQRAASPNVHRAVQPPPEAAITLASPSPFLAAAGQDKPSATTFPSSATVPYGPARIAAFPTRVDRINDQAGLDRAEHVLSWERVPYDSPP